MNIQVGQGNLTRGEYFGQGQDFLIPHELTHDRKKMCFQLNYMRSQIYFDFIMKGV